MSLTLGGGVGGGGRGEVGGDWLSSYPPSPPLLDNSASNFNFIPLSPKLPSPLPLSPPSNFSNDLYTISRKPGPLLLYKFLNKVLKDVFETIMKYSGFLSDKVIRDQYLLNSNDLAEGKVVFSLKSSNKFSSVIVSTLKPRFPAIVMESCTLDFTLQSLSELYSSVPKLEIAVEQAPAFNQTESLSPNHTQKGNIMQDVDSVHLTILDPVGRVLNLDWRIQAFLLELDNGYEAQIKIVNLKKCFVDGDLQVKEHSNCFASVTVNITEEGAIANLDPQAQQFMLELDVLERDAGCEGKMMIEQSRDVFSNKISRKHHWDGEMMIDHTSELNVYKKPNDHHFGFTNNLSERAVSGHNIQIENETLSIDPIQVVHSAEFLVNALVSTEPEPAVEQVPGFGQTIVEGDTITKLDSEQKKSMGKFDALKGGGGTYEAENLVVETINQTKNKMSTSKSVITGTLISLEELHQRCNMTLEKAAKSLGVSKSTLKRTCRQYEISNWSHLRRRKKCESLSQPKSMNIISEQGNIAAGSSQISGNQNSVLHSVNTVLEFQSVTIKVKYGDKTIRFDLPYLSEMTELEEQVAKRLKVEVGSFSIEYVDEDGDQILLTSSEDLSYCIKTMNFLGKTTIKILIKSTTS